MARLFPTDINVFSHPPCSAGLPVGALTGLAVGADMMASVYAEDDNGCGTEERSFLKRNQIRIAEGRAEGGSAKHATSQD